MSYNRALHLSLRVFMKAYPALRRLLFTLPAELSHDLSLNTLALAERTKVLSAVSRIRSSKQSKQLQDESVELLGLHFPNRVGLAAGLDKNGDYFPALSSFGFGFIEIGTVTPIPQGGNPKPRMYRLVDHKAIINRMGFNNKGVDYLCDRVRRSVSKQPVNGGTSVDNGDEVQAPLIGINIGKNKATCDEQALNDYEIGLEQVYLLADYITVNISSPNTPGLRDLQFGENLRELLCGINNKRQQLREKHQRDTPVLVKIAPDMERDDLYQVLDFLLEFKMDGVIATNTTIDRRGIKTSPYAEQAGGLSGAPLTEKSFEMTELIANRLVAQAVSLPLISVGGVMSGEEASRRINAGADLVQLYSGFIYEGPSLVTDCRAAIQANVHKTSRQSLGDAR